MAYNIVDMVCETFELLQNDTVKSMNLMHVAHSFQELNCYHRHCGKPETVPLNEVTSSHLLRLCAHDSDGYIWPHIWKGKFYLLNSTNLALPAGQRSCMRSTSTAPSGRSKEPSPSHEPKMFSNNQNIPRPIRIAKTPVSNGDSAVTSLTIIALPSNGTTPVFSTRLPN